MTFGRQPITIVEIDVDQCALRFDSVEPNASPDLSKSDGDTVTSSEVTRDASIYVVADVVFDATPTGIIWEQGGSIIGSYLGVTSGELVWRAGDGAALPNTACASIRVDASALAGKTCRIVAEVLFADDTVRLRVFEGRVKLVDETGVASAGLTATWAGAADGEIGGPSFPTDIPVGESSDSWNGTITGVDFWEGEFATAGCPASLGGTIARKCFNTFPTCSAQTAYDKGSLTVRFCDNIAGIPKVAGIYPVLKSVSTNPIELNLSGIDPRTSALGKRARINVSLQDFIDDDNYTDPYQAERVSGAAQLSGVGYDTARGNFFAKLVARSPYFLGRALRVKRGYVGDSVASMDTEHYVISEWQGPDAGGNVQIVAKDILDLADDDRAVAPAPSRGKLFRPIEVSDTELTLVPEGIGDDEYPASGRICIGREVMTFTRSGDVVTLVERGVDGTEATDHARGDVAQLCLRYEGQTASDIINDLLTVQGNVDPSFVTIADWQAEENAWLGGEVFTATIAKPTGISQLIGELCQHGILVWWDQVAQQIRFRVNRPLNVGETATTINDESGLIGGQVDVGRNAKQMVNTLHFWHGMIDPTDSETDGRNYAKVAIATDPSSASANENNEVRIKNIYSRWFGREGNDGFAAIIAERLVSRYRNPPVILTGLLDVKDAGLEPADLVDVTSYLITDVTGLSQETRFQIKKVERKNQTVQFVAEKYTLDGRYGYWMDDSSGLPDYSTATDEEKATGAFWFDENEEAFSDGTGPYVYF